MTRRTRIATLAVIAGLAALIGPAPAVAVPGRSSLAVSAPVPAPPSIAAAQAGQPGTNWASSSLASVYVTGPPGSAAEVRLASSPDDPCSKAMEGPDVVGPAPKTITISSNGEGYADFFTPLTAGWFAYATVTIDGQTSAVSDCYRVRPGRVRFIEIPDASPTSLTLAWEAVPDAARYGVELWTRRHTGPAASVTTTDAQPQVTIDGLAPGGVYQATFHAELADGTMGGPSTLAEYLVPPFGTAFDVARRQHLDFFGRPATNDDGLTDFASGYNAGKTTSTIIDEMVDNPYWGKVQGPMVRLMTAYFQRVPDRAGLTYWTDQLRHGHSLRWVSSSFAASGEFRRKYGNLTNAQFVDRVYRNVLGRAPDASGLAFWTRELDLRHTSRGGLMAQFSESSENVRKRQAYVDTIDVVTAMLRRIPTAAELAQWAPSSGTPPARKSLIFSILGSSEYDARVPPPACRVTCDP